MERSDHELALAPRPLAKVLLAISTGATLEQAADPSLDGPLMGKLVAQMVEAVPSPGDAVAGSSGS